MCLRSGQKACCNTSSIMRPQSCPQKTTVALESIRNPAHLQRSYSAPSTRIHNHEVSDETVGRSATTDAESSFIFDSSVAAVMHSTCSSLKNSCIRIASQNNSCANNNNNNYNNTSNYGMTPHSTSQETVHSVNCKQQTSCKLSRSRKKGLLEARGAVKLTLNLLPDIENFDPSPKFLAQQRMEELVFLSTASRRLTPTDLVHAINNLDALFREFWKIPMHYASISDLPRSQSVRSKNRYHTIIPNYESRVILPPLNDQFSDGTYINANYVRDYLGSQRAFIATQGPIDETIGDLWRMVWLTRPHAIVMITALVEKKRRKCALYFPLQAGQSLVVCERSGLSVTTLDVEQQDGWTMRRISLCQTSVNGHVSCHVMNHYWYSSWPDHATPDIMRQLLGLVETVIPLIAKVGPVVVHCSAGVGRTGAFCALCIAIQQLRHEQMCDPLRTVCQLRLDRGGMVQTHEQYEFLHRALLLYVQDHVTIESS